ncbi:coiled-coil domain-containing protein 138 isoform X4 [Hydra vulgaris]|uniref:Coiled-coil domain-containing protein 138 isoform X4 n=1 Tax=Hydra vulgaris TaxID=6087 RepID=A0ABM4CZQ5_HYDVU
MSSDDFMRKKENSMFFKEYKQQYLKERQAKLKEISDIDCSNREEDFTEDSFFGVDQTKLLHVELSEISRKLHHESKKLHLQEVMLNEKEAKLNKIENKLADYALSLEEIVENCVKKKSQELEQEFIVKIEGLKNENVKFKKSFQIIKKAGDKMKEKILFLQEKLQHSEEKNSSQQHRITNLQRQVGILKQQLKEQEAPKAEVKIDLKNNEKTSKFLDTICTSFVGSVLQWITEGHLIEKVKSSISFIKSGSQMAESDFDVTNERCMKVLVTFPALIEHISQQEELFILQFIYWSLIYSYLTKSSQKATHKSTLRRIGEQLYMQQKFCHKSVKRFFSSDDCHARLLSCLIILLTITQADILSQVFHCLCIDLQNDKTKELFVQYHATFALYPLFKLTNKVCMEYTVDVLMVLSSETLYLREFLESISNVEWIQAILTVMKSYNTQVELMDKLSLLLQRISKIRSNKTIFDVLRVKDSVTELISLCKSESIQSNLKSILFNIELMKSRKLCVS